MARYLTIFLVTVFTSVGFVAATNWTVDPYALEGTRLIDRVNAVKVRATQRTEAFKFALGARQPARTLVLGNSRTEMGFDPLSSAWPDAMKPVINLAVPGAALDASRSQLLNALRAQSVRHVVVGLDFSDFLVDPGSAPAPLPPEYVPSPHAMYKERGLALFSFSTLWDSILTVKAQADPYASRLTEQGFNPYREGILMMRSGRYPATVAYLQEDYIRQVAALPKAIRTHDGLLASSFGLLRNLIEVSRKNNVHLVLVLTPHHVTNSVTWRAHGLWPALEEWKKNLVEIASDANQNSPEFVELWDFSRLSTYTTQSIPLENGSDKGLFWEPGHFKSDLGNVMLDAMLNNNSNETWGVRLTRATVDDALRRDLHAIEKFETANPDIVHQITARMRVYEKQTRGR